MTKLSQESLRVGFRSQLSYKSCVPIAVSEVEASHVTSKLLAAQAVR